MANPMSNIKHVVYYMLENRSFDNIMGWLYDSQNPPKHIIASPDKKNIAFMGLEENKYFNQFAGDDTRHFVQKGTESMAVPSPDPNEGYADVNFCLFEQRETPTPDANGKLPEPTMAGFLQDYNTAYKNFLDEGLHLKKDHIDKQTALQILQTYTPEQLPVINGIAKHFAVSDEWFSSVPAQTNCNRAFSLCGTSCGLVNNEGAFFGLKPSKFKTSRSIFETLNTNGFTSCEDWMVFYQTVSYSIEYCYTQEAFNVPNGEDNVAKIDKFFELAASGKLPKFSYLEPDWIGINLNASKDSGENKWGDSNGNSYHPPAELEPGEAFLKKLYDAVTTSPAWKDTLLIITFDEHGGTYDHVPPPWGATPPWGDAEPEFDLECGFKFDRFGVRVPTILASPWVQEGTVFRSLTDVPYDHTSMIATVLDWFGIERGNWGLGERVANAPTFDNVLTQTTARNDVPDIQPSKTAGQPVALKTAPVTDLQKLNIPKAVAKMTAGQTSTEDAVNTTSDILNKAANQQEAQDQINDYLHKLVAPAGQD